MGDGNLLALVTGGNLYFTATLRIGGVLIIAPTEVDRHEVVGLALIVGNSYGLGEVLVCHPDMPAPENVAACILDCNDSVALPDG